MRSRGETATIDALFASFFLAVVLSLFALDDPSDAQGSGPSLPTVPYDYANPPLPEHFRVNSFPDSMPWQTAATENDNMPADNPVTDEGATLGRVLFYDKTLSANGTTSCASCHLQEVAFTDPATVSSGFEGGTTRRASMTLANARFFGPASFFWDQRAETLEQQVLMPFVDPVELGLTLDELIEIVDGRPYYPALFVNAFGDDEVTADRISRALAQFVRSIVSFESPYDDGRMQVDSPLDPFPNFTDEENLGKDLFFQRPPPESDLNLPCAACHVSEAMVFTAGAALNNGLDRVSTVDCGLYETTGVLADVGKFKPSSLRNIALTGPYMHDGRFATLEDVIEHYSTGVQDHVNLSGALKEAPRGTGPPLRRNFTASESIALVAFLNTLTDPGLLTAEKYSDPFPSSGSADQQVEPSGTDTPSASDETAAAACEQAAADAVLAAADAAAGDSGSGPLRWIAASLAVVGVAAIAVVVLIRRRRLAGSGD